MAILFAATLPSRLSRYNGIDPEAWLTDVLERIVSGRTKNNQLHELLAWHWKAAREAVVEKAAA